MVNRTRNVDSKVVRGEVGEPVSPLHTCIQLCHCDSEDLQQWSRS